MTGATGNVGTAVLRRLHDVEVTGVVRRPPDLGRAGRTAAGTTGTPAGVRWVAVDLASDDAERVLAEALEGLDAVVHLAWGFQPGRDDARLRATAVDGTLNVARAAVRAGVPHLVHMSSVGAYAPRTSLVPVTESYPTTGVPGSAYSRDKADVERILDGIQEQHPELAVARLRPGLVGQGDAGSALLRYSLPALVPKVAVRLVPVLPMDRGTVVPVVHADDVADAVRRVLDRQATGAFNLAAEPPVDAAAIATALGARLVHVPAAVVRGAAAAAWHARLSRLDPGWLDLAHVVPLVDTTRARDELGWTPRVSATDALAEAVEGMADGPDGGTPVLRPRTVAAEARRLLTGLSTSRRPTP
ncbi:NAD-dependent epimerase/dehydratase family protein [uncultured Nocardioides sp.]|uniref:NAD-dependent epimerase/dehydratase family protein n=1 Tax=uncultured Nocardioides sp. TaxID=198441 RepID=UPI002632C928|nr:NAD-dependent epimerase/dehydratase family protein [uncultured Nocardioides sp.]